jgi:hypothetical protein
MTHDQSDVRRLEQARTRLRRQMEEFLTSERRAHGDTLTDAAAVKWRSMQADLRTVEDDLEDRREDVSRANLDTNPTLARLRAASDGRTSAMTTTENRRFDDGTVYRAHDNRTSWLRDLMRLETGRDTTGESRNRLMQHASEVENAGMEFRDISRLDGSGGYSVPPAWLMSQYIELARPGRAFANLVQRQPLPGGTDSINIPKLGSSDSSVGRLLM